MTTPTPGCRYPNGYCLNRDEIKRLEAQLAAAQEANAKLKAHAEAMAETLDSWARLDGGCKCVALDAYRRDFPKDTP